MHKEELIEQIAKESGLSKKESRLALDAFVSVVKKAVAEGDEVKLAGFGGFKAVKKVARKFHNPKTTEVIESPAKVVPVFKPGRVFKDAVKLASGL
jgi:DNA-binding protein HU-beta